MDLQPMTTSYCRHSPSLSREGKVLHSSVNQLLHACFLQKRIFRLAPAICKDCTVSRIQPGFLPTYEPWLIPTRIPKGFADSKQSLRPLSFLSRTGNVLHSSRESAFACLLFNKVEEVQHSIVIPSDSHSGINYPPFANADGFETTDCLECLQILNILIYGRRVYFKAGDWILCTMIGYRIPERETCCILHLRTALGF